MIKAVKNFDVDEAEYFGESKAYCGYNKEEQKNIYANMAGKMEAAKEFAKQARPMLAKVETIEEYLMLLKNKRSDYYKLHAQVFGEGKEADYRERAKDHLGKRNKFYGRVADDLIAAVIFWILVLPENLIHKVLEYIPYVPGGSDTIGCVAGHFIGAYLGDEKLRQRIDQKKSRFEDLEKYEKMMKVADGLATLVHHNVLSDEETADSSSEDTVSLHDGKEEIVSPSYTASESGSDLDYKTHKTLIDDIFTSYRKQQPKIEKNISDLDYKTHKTLIADIFTSYRKQQSKIEKNINDGTRQQTVTGAEFIKKVTPEKQPPKNGGGRFSLLRTMMGYVHLGTQKTWNFAKTIVMSPVRLFQYLGRLIWKGLNPPF
jgi:hypothetical protein